MKIRNGFVSNSSSSSFCIYGVPVEKKSDIEEKLENSQLKYTYGQPYSDYDYVGRDWSSVKDDETGKQFKTTIREEIEKLGLNTKEIGTYEESWYDG